MLFTIDKMQYRDILSIDHLEIEKKRITALLGESGAGKTTLLKLLNKMLSPTEGRVLYEGKDLGALPSVAHRREVALMSQTPVIIPGSVRDNLVMGFAYQDRPVPSDADLIAMLERVHLDKGLSEEATRLSGGEKQRLGLGRLLLLDAPVYLLDEPSSALDEKTERRIIEAIVAFTRERGKSLVMVTHKREIATDYADQIIELEKGGKTR